MSIGRLKRELDRLLPQDPKQRAPYLSILKGENPELHRQLQLALVAAENQTTFLSPTRDAVRVRASSFCPPAAIKAGTLIGGRYRIEGELGFGSFARVYEAHDQVSERSVAVKVFQVEDEAVLDQVRREAAALRLLRLPGIVELHDDAREGGLAFIVMDRIQGKPFPGDLPCGVWDALAQRFVELLQILARIHWAGVVHCDLKPSNVFVDQEGRLHVLDLGISRGPRIEQGTGPRDSAQEKSSVPLAGTLGYMAPELYEGACYHPGSDLYAVGIMLRRSMAALELMEGERVSDAVPGFVAKILLPGLLAEDPVDRFPSAERVLELLLPDDVSVGAAAPDSLEDLDPEVLFAGSERLHWIASDAGAALILECVETGASPKQVLQRWTRAGLGRWEGGRYVITRAALEQLGQRLKPGEVGDAAQEAEREPAHGRDGSEDLGKAEMAMELAQEALGMGKLDTARLYLEQGLILLRGQFDQPVSQRGYALLIQWALALGTRQSVHEALYELKRFPDSDRIRPFESLARAALLAMDGDVQGCLDLLDEIGRIDEIEADYSCQSIRAFAARCSPDPCVHEKAKAFLGAWAQESTHPNAKGGERDWAGWFAYFDGQYVLAGSLQEQARDLLSTPAHSLATAVHAATSYLEGESYEDARRLATSALARAEELRHPHFAARAEWVLRSVDYRTATDQDPDLDLVEAAAQLEVPHLYAQICLNEAAFAWRRSQLAAAIDLARRAHEAFTVSGDPAASFLTISFLLALTGDRSTPLPKLQSGLDACLTPMLALQALALLAEAEIQKTWAIRSAQPLLASLPPSLASRREILSLSECQTRLI